MREGSNVSQTRVGRVIAFGNTNKNLAICNFFPAVIHLVLWNGDCDGCMQGNAELLPQWK